jgi:hypothetical protein
MDDRITQKYPQVFNVIYKNIELLENNYKNNISWYDILNLLGLAIKITSSDQTYRG